MGYKILIIIAILIIFHQESHSQEISKFYGSVNDYEINMIDYKKDPDAEAVILFDRGESGYIFTNSGIEKIHTRHKKIKIFKKSYIDKTTYTIPIINGKFSKEKLKEFEAIIYNNDSNGISKTVIDKSNIFGEDINGKTWLYKFTLPNIKVGSVIEYRYKIRSPYYNYLEDWRFQSDIPTILSEYVVKMIPNLSFQMRLQGTKKLDENYKIDTDTETIHYFIMKDIPAFKNEEFITTKEDYIIKLDFQIKSIITLGGRRINILSSWEELVRGLQQSESFGTYIIKSENNYKKIAKKRGISDLNQQEQLDYIINDIKKSYKWNNVNYIYTGPLKNFLKQKSGSCSEINLYLCGALRSVGIESYPVILSTRNNGKIYKSFPFVDPFNYVLVYAKINDKWSIYDATDILCPNNRIPKECINDFGLLIKETNSVNWLKILENRSSNTLRNFTSYFSSDMDTLYSEVSLITTGYSALKYRKLYENIVGEIEKGVLIDNIQLEGEIETKDFDSILKPYQIKYKISTLTNKIGNKLIIHPFLNLPINDNPLKQNERGFPIDMIYPNTYIYFTELRIPENFKIEKLPENFELNNKLITIQYSASMRDKVVMIKGIYKFKKSVYQPEDYAKIKHYFNLIVENLNQKIVLIEKKRISN